MRLRFFLVLLAALSVAAVIGVRQAPGTFVNGRLATKPVLEKDGDTYIALSDLIAGGATVSRHQDRTWITFPQELSVSAPKPIEGKIGEWVTDGTWSVRVEKVQWQVRQWNVQLSFRNEVAVKLRPGDGGFSGARMRGTDGIYVVQLGFFQQQCGPARVLSAAVARDRRPPA
jgi:hypothetical protein